MLRLVGLPVDVDDRPAIGGIGRHGTFFNVISLVWAVVAAGWRTIVLEAVGRWVEIGTHCRGCAAVHSVASMSGEDAFVFLRS